MSFGECWLVSWLWYKNTLVLPVSGSRPLGSSSYHWVPHTPPRSCETGGQVTPPVAPPGSSVAGLRASSWQSPVSRIWFLNWWKYKRIVGLPLTSLIDWYIKFSYQYFMFNHNIFAICLVFCWRYRYCKYLLRSSLFLLFIDIVLLSQVLDKI